MEVALDFREQGPDSPTEGVETEGAEQEVEVQRVDPEQRLALTLQKLGLLQGASYRQECNRKSEWLWGSHRAGLISWLHRYRAV